MKYILLSALSLLRVKAALVCAPQVVFNFNPVIPCGAPNVAEADCYKLNCCWQWLDPDGKFVNTDIPNPRAGLDKPVCHQEIEEADILTAAPLTTIATPPGSKPTSSKNGSVDTTSADKEDKPQSTGGTFVWIVLGFLTFAVIILATRYLLKKRNRGVSTDFSQEPEITKQNIVQRRSQLYNQPTRMSAIALPVVEQSSITWEAFSAQTIPEGNEDETYEEDHGRYGNEAGNNGHYSSGRV